MTKLETKTNDNEMELKKHENKPKVVDCVDNVMRHKSNFYSQINIFFNYLAKYECDINVDLITNFREGKKHIDFLKH